MHITVSFVYFEIAASNIFMIERRTEEDDNEKGEPTDEEGQLILAIQSKNVKQISQLLSQGVSVHSSGKKTGKIQLNQTSEPFLEVWYFVRVWLFGVVMYCELTICVGCFQLHSLCCCFG